MPPKTLILIPAFNEAMNLPDLIAECGSAMPDTPVLIVSDGSVDETAVVALRHGALVLDLPFNLGVSGAVQVGFQYALRHGYERVVRIDGDGQHPPEGIPVLLERLEEGDVDIVIGSRFGTVDSITSTLPRRLGISVLGAILTRMCKASITDPTSGFMALNRRMLYFFSQTYPTDYPEPEALALLRRQGFSFAEVSVRFRERQGGVSTIGPWGAVYFVAKVSLALIVDRMRGVDPRLNASNVDHLLEAM